MENNFPVIVCNKKLIDLNIKMSLKINRITFSLYLLDY